MQYFDFNIPYVECPPSAKAAADKSARKQNRLKLVVKAMELGYAGVAYNYTIKGVMSESDRCSIPPFPLSSLLSISPSLSSAASFHRRLLGTRVESPFRQYTRLTVTVDDNSQATALNSGNAILKTYDLVAARPMNQKVFEQICQYSEVHLIVIDFSDKLPFRLKLPMIKAAISRGVYFEITYSGLLADVHVRRQLISNAKLLVEWTRGKNVIVSSAAPSVLEFRGPNDVANLLSLLGFSNEHAKAAISKNCRSLIANALRKKQFLKGVIKVEQMPSGKQLDPTKPWNNIDSLEWDPISSEGDLVLDDLAKSFSEAGKVSKPTKAIDFDKITNRKDTNFLPTKHIKPGIKNESHRSDGDADKASVSHVRQPMSLFSRDSSQNLCSSEPFRLCTSSGARFSGATSSTCELKQSADLVPSTHPSTQPDLLSFNHGLGLGTSVLDTDTTEVIMNDVAVNGGLLNDSDVKVNCGKTRHPSRNDSKAGKDKSKRKGLKFPFKNVFQIPPIPPKKKKKKSSPSKLKIKK